MFKADTVDDLPLEQYNVLIELWNMQAEASVESTNKRTTKIITVPGKPGVNYGND